MSYVVTGYWNSGYTDTESSDGITNDLQGISPTAIIELFQLELDAAQHGVDVIHYLSGLNQGGLQAITFGGQAYTAIPLEAEGFSYSGQGSLPRPTLRLSNLFGTITGLIAPLPNGLEGAKVTRIRTLARYIDNINFSSGSNPFGTPDSTATFPKEIYYVDRKSVENRSLIEFELASAFDLAGVRAPKRQCISRCQWVYKSVECGYDPAVGPGKVVNGVTFTRFTANDVGTTADGEDVCGKRQSSCECRFGENNELPFGGYPGIGTFFA